MTRPSTIDLYTVRTQWLALLSALQQGQTVLIIRGGHPFARLIPAASSDPSSLALPLRDPDTAQRVRALVDAYQASTLASLLGMSEFRLRTLLDTGLADEPLFQSLVTLETMAQVLFSEDDGEPGQRWLLRHHPQLRHHPPLFTLRGSLAGTQNHTAHLLYLA